MTVYIHSHLKLHRVRTLAVFSASRTAVDFVLISAALERSRALHQNWELRVLIPEQEEAQDLKTLQ